jgi:FkbM family methyltransferase
VDDIGSAQYRTWSQFFEASARQSPLGPKQVERRLFRFFKDLCRTIDPSVVLEIGAHQAYFSRWAAEHLPRARVKAFEANPHTYANYAPKLAGTRVEYRHLAVGSVTGEVQLNLPSKVPGKQPRRMTRMASLGRHTEAHDNIQVTVPAVRLEDDLALDDADSVVAWIDVEGANEQVFAGFGTVLDRVQALFIEVERETTWEGQWLDVDVHRFLHARGFVPLARDLLRARRHQYNVVYARPPLATDRRTARLAARVFRGPRESE